MGFEILKKNHLLDGIGIVPCPWSPRGTYLMAQALCMPLVSQRYLLDSIGIVHAPGLPEVLHQVLAGVPPPLHIEGLPT